MDFAGTLLDQDKMAKDFQHFVGAQVLWDQGEMVVYFVGVLWVQGEMAQDYVGVLWAQRDMVRDYVEFLWVQG